MKLKSTPINAMGYGVIPKLVMKAQNLSVGAKAVYAYIASYAGQGDTAFPSRKAMCADLNIENNTLGKYLNELTKGHYLVIEKRRTEKGVFQNNVYRLTTDPCIKSPYMDKPYTAEPYMAEPYTANGDTNSNKDKSNISNSNKEKSNKSKYGEFQNVLLTDDEMEKLKQKFPSTWERWIQRLDEYIESKGAKYKSHYATILTWARKDDKKGDVPVLGTIHY